MPLPSVPDEIDRLFEELIRRPWGLASRPLVPAELRTVEDGWVVELPVEGLGATDLKVEVQGRQLTVSGHRRHQQRQFGKTGWSRTQQEVSLYRRIPLPSNADPEGIEAKIEGATLSIHIRRRQP